MRRSGPLVSENWRVLSAWDPALCSPLNGVGALAQPALPASVGELNQTPTWYSCTGAKAGFVLASGIGWLCTTGAGPDPGATAKVSTLKRPTKVPWALPRPLDCRSPWYQEMPVKGHQELNAGGHEMCTLADSRTERWWPSDLRGPVIPGASPLCR